jgi:hypothetical protein
MTAPAADCNRPPPIPSPRPVNADSPPWTAGGHRPTGSLEETVRFGGKSRTGRAATWGDGPRREDPFREAQAV